MSNHIDSMLRTVYDNWKVSRPKDGTRTSIDIDGLFKDIMAEEQCENIRVATGQTSLEPSKDGHGCLKLVCQHCQGIKLRPTTWNSIRLDSGCYQCEDCNSFTYFDYPKR